MSNASPPPSPAGSPGPQASQDAGTPTPSPAGSAGPQASPNAGTPTPSPSPGVEPEALTNMGSYASGGPSTPGIKSLGAAAVMTAGAVDHGPLGEGPTKTGSGTYASGGPSTPGTSPLTTPSPAAPAGTATPSPAAGKEPTAVGTPTPSPPAGQEPTAVGTPTPSPAPGVEPGKVGLGGYAEGANTPGLKKLGPAEKVVGVAAVGALGADPTKTGSGTYAEGGPNTPGLQGLGSAPQVSGQADTGELGNAPEAGPAAPAVPNVSSQVPQPLTSMAAAAPSSGDGTAEPLITSNFILVVDGLTCGRWTECSGLSLKYGGKDYYEGGQPTASRLMDVQSSQTLTVSRPWGPASVEMLYWFELYGHIVIPLTAFVAACDYQGNVLYWWELMGVTPLQWTGPKFKAGEAAVAMETLVLSYTDFLGYGSGDAAGVVGGVLTAAATIGTAVISALAGPSLSNDLGGTLNFDLVPGSFKIGGSVKMNTKPTPTMNAKPGTTTTTTTAGAGQNQPQVLGLQPRTLVFNMTLDATTMRLSGNTLSNPMSLVSSLTGAGISAGITFIYQCMGLPAWGSPSPANPAAAVGAAVGAAMGALGGSSSSNSAGPPEVTFKWGSFVFKGWWQNFSLKITRLDMMGNPMRAEVAVTIVENPQNMPSQNPTSGGKGIRQVHTIVAGDTLASISYEACGKADMWRLIAEMNGIDDPVRLRPGRTLLLPSKADIRAAKHGENE
jgi:phage tail-like protein